MKARDSSGLNINVGMRKVLVVKNDQMESCEKVRVSGKEMQEVLRKVRCRNLMV